MAVGEQEVDFGAGTWEAIATVTGQASILVTSKVEGFIMAKASADHSADEHRVEDIGVVCGNIVAGTGFTIYARARGKRPLMGRWLVQWVWV